MPPQPHIAADQPVAVMAKQVLMTVSERRLITYRQVYHLGYTDQRQSLLHTLEKEFHRTADLPTPVMVGKNKDKFAFNMVFYLVIADGEPILLPEEQVLPWVFGYVFGKAGREAAERISYRPDMLTTKLPRAGR